MVYTFTRKLGIDFVKEVYPKAEDTVLETYGADKFFRTRLDNVLSHTGAKYLVVVGTRANGAVMYTAFEAVMRSYTVILLADCVSADTDTIRNFVLWQALNSPGRSNPDNTPLAPLAVTLTTESRLQFV